MRTGRHDTDDLSGPYPFAFADGGRDRLETGEQIVAVLDGDHRPVDHRADEGHHAVGGGANRIAFSGHEVDAPVPGRVPASRRLERS